MKMDQPANPKEALPVVTFSHDVTLHVNGEDIRALHAPSGHTDGDSIVFFPKSNVVHFGDDFVRYGFPFIDINGGGSSMGMIAALETAMTQLPQDVKVIPGHGALATLDDVRTYVTMLKETRGVVEQGIKTGKTLQQLQQEKALDAWQKYSGQFVSTDLFIETLYNELTGKKTAALMKH
jgi:cyclase